MRAHVFVASRVRAQERTQHAHTKPTHAPHGTSREFRTQHACASCVKMASLYVLYVFYVFPSNLISILYRRSEPKVDVSFVLAVIFPSVRFVKIHVVDSARFDGNDRSDTGGGGDCDPGKKCANQCKLTALELFRRGRLVQTHLVQNRCHWHCSDTRAAGRPPAKWRHFAPGWEMG